jgi:hypothetical protein
LTKTAWAGVMLDDVVATTLAPFRDGNGSAVNASGQSAANCALSQNSLASLRINAVYCGHKILDHRQHDLGARRVPRHPVIHHLDPPILHFVGLFNVASEPSVAPQRS